MAASLEFWLYLPQMRLSHAPPGRAGAQPPRRRASTASPAWTTWRPHGPRIQPMFEAMITNDVARRAHVPHSARRLPRAVRLLPPSRAAGPRGGHARPCLGWPLRARHRLGLGGPRVRHRSASDRPNPSSGSAGSRNRSRSSRRCGAARPSTTKGSTSRCSRPNSSRPRSVASPSSSVAAGRKTMELVATYADWWNVHVSILDRFDEMRPQAGRARPSLQVQVGTRRIRRPTARKSTRPPSAGSAASIVAGSPRSSSTTSARSANAGSNASTSGSPTSPPPRRWRSSAQR